MRITFAEFEKNGGRAILCRNPENVEEDCGTNEDVWPIEYMSRNLKEFLEHENISEYEFLGFCQIEGRGDLGNEYLLTPDLVELNNTDTLDFSMYLNEFISPLYGVIYHVD